MAGKTRTPGQRPLPSPLPPKNPAVSRTTRMRGFSNLHPCFSALRAVCSYLTRNKRISGPAVEVSWRAGSTNNDACPVSRLEARVKLPSAQWSRQHVARALTFRPGANTLAESRATAAALALLPWALVSVIGLPLLAGQPPQWTASGMRVLFPSLVGWVLGGAVAGVLAHALATLVTWRLGPEPGPIERRYRQRGS